MNSLFKTVLLNDALAGQVRFQMNQSDLPGFIVKDFFTDEEVISLLTFYNTSPAIHKTCNYPGFLSFPASFPKFTTLERTGEMHWNDRLNEADMLHTFFNSNAGVFALPRLKNFLSAFFPGICIQDMCSPDGRWLPMLSYRELLPGAGEFAAHTETLTFEAHRSYFGAFADKLWSMPYSFFTVLQKPEAGGELCCFDVQENAADKVVAQGRVERQGGDVLDFNTDDTLPRYYITPEVGDLVVFNSGSVWHRVELVRGSRIAPG